MSHVATIELNIANLDDLDAACKRIGLELARGQQTFKWFGKWVNDYAASDAAYKNGIKPEDYGKCEHAIRVPCNSDSYEIGVLKNPDGKPGYRLVWDFFQGGYGLQALAGDNCARLKQAYALSAATRAARAQGYAVTERLGANGSVQLVCQ